MLHTKERERVCEISDLNPHVMHEGMERVCEMSDMCPHVTHKGRESMPCMSDLDRPGLPQTHHRTSMVTVLYSIAIKLQQKLHAISSSPD